MTKRPVKLECLSVYVSYAKVIAWNVEFIGTSYAEKFIIIIFVTWENLDGTHKGVVHTDQFTIVSKQLKSKLILVGRSVHIVW